MKKSILFMMLISSFASAHGMSELGPHKGYIQMPGAFHTEVLQNKDGSFKIYLLDIEFKNPMTEKSEVKAAVQAIHSKRKTDLMCMVMGDYFHCILEGTQAIKKGELFIAAKRGDAVGAEAVYKLPLKIVK
jgi:hypothetical protein